MILAKRDIQPGEEVTYDYQFEHYGLGDMVTNYKCLCGAPNCRGTMDRQPERCKVKQSQHVPHGPLHHCPLTRVQGLSC